MKRDGITKSLWQHVSEYQSANNWSKQQIYDVLIVGGGITGLTTALLLQKQGKKCILAEAYNIGFGTTGGTTGHLNTMLDTSYDEIEKKFGSDEAKLVAKGTHEAIELIEELTGLYDIDADFSYQSGYLFAQTDDEAEKMESIKKAAQKAGVVVNESNTIPVPLPFKKALSFQFQGQIHPINILQDLRRLLKQKGV